MKSPPPTISSILRKVREANQTPLYKWMATNHAKMAAAAARGRVTVWTDLVRDFEALGLLDGHGKPPSVQSARKTWGRVKDDVEKARQEACRAARLSPPSRQRADWQPPSTGTPASSSLPVSTIREFEPNEEAAPRRRALEPPAHAPPSVSKKMTIEDLTPEARAQIESLRQDFAATDRKRFGRF